MDQPSAEETVERATARLGEPEALFRASPRWQRTKFIAAFGLILFGIVVNIAWFGFGPARADHVLIHFLVVPLGIGTVLLYTLWRHRGLRVLLYPEGLLRLQHGEADSFPWDDVTSVRWKLESGDEPHIERDDDGVIVAVWFEAASPRFQVWNVWIELTRSDGQTLKLSAVLDDFPELARRIQVATFAPLRAAVEAAFERGNPAIFGPDLFASREAVSTAKMTVKWSEVKSFTLAAKFLSMKKASMWGTGITRLMPTIANLHVLVALAAENGVYKPKTVE